MGGRAGQVGERASPVSVPATRARGKRPQSSPTSICSGSP